MESTEKEKPVSVSGIQDAAEKLVDALGELDDITQRLPDAEARDRAERAHQGKWRWLLDVLEGETKRANDRAAFLSIDLMEEE